MVKAGDVVTVDFPGATGLKRRPAVVISGDQYHQHRPDVIVSVVTGNLASARTPMDHILLDWSAAGLHVPSAFRCYFGMALSNVVRPIGRLSDRDWDAVRICLRRALPV